MFLRYNTATEIDFFMPDNSDPWSGKTGLTSITVQYKKQGQSAFTTLSSPTISEIGNGWYKLSVPTSLVDTYGFLVIRFSATGAKTEQHVYQVVAFNPYDSNMGLANLDAAVSSRLASSSYVAPDNTSISAIKAQTDKLTFDASNRIHSYLVAVSGGAITAGAFGAGAITSGAIADGAITAAKIATDAIAGSKIAADAVTKIAGGILQNTSNKLYTTAGGAVQLDMTQSVPANPTTNTVGYSLRASSDVATQNVSVRADVNSFTSNGSSALQNNVFTVVWGAQTTALTGTGTIGKKVNDNLDATISSRLPAGNVTVGGYASGQNPATLVWGASTRTLTGLGNSLVDEIWHRVRSASDPPAGSFGYYLDAQVSSAGGSGASDWTAAEKQQIRYVLGIDGTKTAPTGNTGWIPDIRSKTQQLTFDASNRIHSYVTAISGGVITSGSFAAGAITSGVVADGTITAAKIATDAIAGSKVAADAVTKIAGGILQNTSNKLYTTAGGAVQLDMGQTLPSNPTTNTVGYSLKAASDVANQNVPVLAEVYDFTTSSLTVLNTTVSNAVWGEPATALTGAGTIGKKVNDNLDVPVSTRLASADYSTSSIASAVWGYADRQLTALSTGLAVAVWNVPTANVTAASSIGLRLRDNIDAAISSRSTLTAAQVWTHSDRQLTALSTGLALSVWNVPTTSVTATSTIGLQLKTNVDATVSSRSTLSISDVQTALTNQGYTTARAAKLDYLDGSVTGAVSSVWGAQVTALTGDGTIGKHIVTYLDTPVSNAATPVDVSNAVASTPVVLHSSNVSTLVNAVTSGMTSQGYTTARAQNLDNLDVAVSTRLATTGYTAPPTTGQIATAVWTHSDRQLTAISTGLALNVWHVPATGVTAAGTIGLQLKTNIDATVSSRSTLNAADVTNAVWTAATGSSYGTSTFGTLIKTNLDAPVSTRLASSSYTAPPTVSDIASAVWTYSTRQITDMSANAALTVWHTPTTSVTAANTIGLQLKTNVDATISSRSTLTSGQVQTVFDNQGYTTARAARLDNLDAAVSSRSTLTAANVWSYSDRQLTALSTGLALSVWNVPAANVTAANTIGLQLKTNVDAAISSRSTLNSSDVTTAVWAAASGNNYGTGSMGTLLKTNLDVPVSTRLASASYVSPPGTSDIAAAVWSHTSRQITDMSAGAALAVWHTPATSVTAANTIGLQVKTNLDATVSSRSTLDQSGVQSAMTNLGYTAARASRLDYLDVAVSSRLASADYSTSSIAAAVWGYSTRELTAISTGVAISVWNVPTANINTANTIGLLLKTNVDATISSRSVLTTADVRSSAQQALTDQGYTTARAAKLDYLDGSVTGSALSVWSTQVTALTGAGTIGKHIVDYLDTPVSNAATPVDVSNAVASTPVVLHSSNLSTLVSAVTSGMTGQGYTTARASKLDYLDVAVSSRLASADYTAPPTTTGIASAVWTYSDRQLTALSTGLALSVWHVPVANITANSTIGLQLKTNVDVATSTRLAASSYTAPDNTTIGNIWSKVQNLSYTQQGSNYYVNAYTTNPGTIDYNQVATSVWSAASGTNYGSGAMGTLIKTNLDATVSSRLASTAYTAPPTTGQIAGAVWTHTDRQLTAISTGLAVSVWNVPTANVTAASSIGLRLRDNVDATISSRSTLTISDVQTALTNQGYTSSRAVKLDNLDVAVSSRLASADYSTAAIASAVWGYGTRELTAISTGLALSVWHVPATSVTATGTLGLQLKTNVDATISSRSTLTTGDVRTASMTALTDQGYTTTRATKLDNLDVAVSSRLSASSYVTPPTPSDVAAAVWTHTTRSITDMTTGAALAVWHTPATSVTAANTVGLQIKTNLDATVSSRSTLDQSGVQSAMINLGYTAGRAVKLDYLDVAVSSRLASADYSTASIAGAVWGYSTRELTAISTGLAVSVWNVPTANVTAANSIGLRLRDNIDVAISTRLAASSYVAPPNTSDIAGAVWTYSTRQITDMNATAALAVWHTPAANVTAANTIGLQIKTNVDAAISSRSTLTTGDVRSAAQQALTDQGYTTTRAAKLDYLDGSVTGSVSSVWSTPVTALTGDGTIGKYIVTYLDTPVSNAATPVDVSNAVASTPVVLHSSNLSTLVGAVASGMTSQGYTVARASNLDNLDVAVSSRLAASSYVTPPTTGQIASAVWTHSDRQLTAVSTGLALSVWHVPATSITAAGTIGLQVKTNVDTTISSRSTLTSGQVQTVLDNQGYTSTRAAKLDNLDVAVSSRLASADYSPAGIAGAVWGYSTRELTAISTGLAVSVWNVPTASVTAANSIGLQLKNNIDTTISSRLAASSYTAPDNTTIGNVWSKVQNLSYTQTGSNYYVNAYTTNPGTIDYNQVAASVWSAASGTDYGANTMGTLVKTNLDATISSRLAASSYTAPPTTGQIATAVWTHTDRQLTSLSTGLALSVWNVPTANVTAAGSIGLRLRDNIDVAVSTRLAASSYVAPPTISDIASAVWGYTTRQVTDMTANAALTVWHTPAANITAANTIGLQLKTNVDAAISTRSTLTSGQVQTVLDNQGYTSTRAAYLDRLDVAVSTRLASADYSTSSIASAVWSYSTRELTAISTGLALSVWNVPSANVTAANSIGLRLRDNIDVAISTRLAASSYVTPPTISDIAAAVWSYTNRQITDMSSDAALSVWHTPATSVTAANTIGLQLKTNVNATISSRSTLTVSDIQTAMTNQGYTTGRAAKLDNLDVAVSTRLAASSYIAPPTTSDIASAVWTYSNRQITDMSSAAALSVWHVPAANVTAANTLGLQVKTNLDAPVSSRSTLTSGQVQTVFDNQGYTTARAAKLDNLDATISSRSTLSASQVWSYSDRQLTSLSTSLALSVWNVPSANVSTSNSIGLRLRDNIDATISSRLAASNYTAPDNTTIANIWSKVQNLSYTQQGNNYYVNAYTTNPGSVDYNQIASSVWSYSTRQLSDYSAIAPAVWGYSARTITNATDIAGAVWSHTTRTLTDMSSLAEDVWRVRRTSLGGLYNDSFGYLLDRQISSISAGGSGGGFVGPYEVTFSFVDAEDISVGSVIFTVDGVGSAMTDGDGIIKVNLPAGDYIVRAVPQQGVLFSPVSFSVTGNTTIKVRGSMRGITYAPYDGTCRFVQRVVDANGQPVSGITATMTILDLPTGVDGNRWPIGTVYTVVSDDQGKIVFPAVPSGTRVRVEIPSMNYVREMVAPSTNLMTIY